MEIFLSILILGGLGLIFGAGLAQAAQKFYLAVDPKLENIYEKLPQANCGACGMSSCMAFAEKLIQGICTLENCVVSEEESRKEIAKILGIEAKTKIKKTAVLHCGGGNKRTKDKFKYRDILDCIAANLVLGGPKACVYGCIGLGTCAKICPFDAITMNTEALPVIDINKCTACGKCVAICPKKLFSLVPLNSIVWVACKSCDLGKDIKSICAAGCIACKLCEKACPYDAIHVIDNVAVIDYQKCTSCGGCVKVCPTKTIQETPAL